MAEKEWYWHLRILKNIDVKREIFIAFSVALGKRVSYDCFPWCSHISFHTEHEHIDLFWLYITMNRNVRLYIRIMFLKPGT